MRIRVYVPADLLRPGEGKLGREEAHHLSRVLRVARGAPVEVFDGQGTTGQAAVLRASREEVILRVEGTAKVPAPIPSLVLAAALVQGKRFDQIVDQATQLGASEIIPLVTSRTVVQPDAARRQTLVSRFRQIAREACRQSGVNHLPVVHPVTDFKTLLAGLGGYDLVLLGALQGEREPVRPLLTRQPLKRLLLLIGPEGDFTPEEIGQARKAGARPFSMGPRVLRCETAAAAALGVIGFLLLERPS